MNRRYAIYYESEIGESPINYNYLPNGGSNFLAIYGNSGISEAAAFSFIPAKDFILSSIDAWIYGVSSPPTYLLTDLLECQLWIVAGSQFAVCSNPASEDGLVLYKFRFPRQPLKAGTSYSIVFERTGSRDTNAYWKLMCKTTGIPADGGWYRNSSIWYQSATLFPHITLGDYRWQLKHDYELNKRAQSATIDLGKNDIDSKFKEGKADIVFRNKDNYLDPTENGNMQLNRLMRLSVLEDIQVVDSFDNLDGWSDISGSPMQRQLNYDDKIEGNACFDIGTVASPSNAFFGMEKTLASGVDISDNKEIWLSHYIFDLLKLESSAQVITIEMGNDSSNKYRWIWWRNDAVNPERSLLNGWQELSFNIGNANSTFGTPVPTNITYLAILWQADTTSTVVPVGEIKIDWWRIAKHKNLFTGYTNRFRPQLNIEDKTLNVALSDAFAFMKKKKVSVGTLTSKKVSEIVEALLVAASIDPVYYEIDDTDTTILNSVTWDNVSVMGKLEECVEVGQHHHFVDGSGIYQFKSNQWLEDPTPDYTYGFDSVNPDMDDFNFEFDIKGIFNHVRVKYPTDLWADVEDADSILKYNRRLREIDNELMPSGGAYALGVANYALDALRNAKQGAEFWIKNRYPDIIDMEIGNILSIYNPFTTNYDLFTVLGSNRKVDDSGEHDLKVRCKSWTPTAPLTEWYDLKPFDLVTTEITPSDRQNSYGESQGFLVTPTTGQIWHLKIYGFQRVAELFSFTAFIYNVDGAGKPTGSALATSEPVIVGGSAIPYPIVFPFTGSDRISLTSGNNYAWVIELSGGGVTRLWGFLGKNADVYSGGVPAWMDNLGVWTVLPHDRYFEIRLKV
jgi:hypothetical protein